MEGIVSRILVVTTIIVTALGFVDSANATNSRAQGKAGQRAMCHDKIGAKHLSGDPMKAEWKKCMEDANTYSDGRGPHTVVWNVLASGAADRSAAFFLR
jgi:hypothetical protein